MIKQMIMHILGFLQLSITEVEDFADALSGVTSGNTIGEDVAGQSIGAAKGNTDITVKQWFLIEWIKGRSMI
jgi:hypothetical protein